MFRLFFQSRQYRFHRFICPPLIRNLRFSFGNGSGFVQRHGIHFLRQFQAFGIFYQYPVFGAFAHAHHNGRWRCQPQRTRTGDHQHRDESQQRVRERIVSAENQPNDKRKNRDSDNHRHENSGNFVHQFLHRRFASLRVLHHVDDVRQHRFLAHFIGAKPKTSLLVDGSGKHLFAFRFSHGHRFAAEHALVHKRIARNHRAVHGNFLARFYQHDIADRNVFDGHFYLIVAINNRNRFRLQAHQLFQRRRSAAFGALFQQPPQQNKRDNYRRRFKINVRVQPFAVPKLGEKHVENAKNIRRSGTQRHQRIHIGGSMTRLFPRGNEKIPAQPKHHRSGKRPHNKIAVRHIHEKHTDNHHRKR